MRKFLLDLRKDFLIMSNFYLVEILSEPNSLTLVTRKKILKMSSYVLILSIFFSYRESGICSVLKIMLTLILLNSQVYQAPESVIMNHMVHNFYELRLLIFIASKQIIADHLRWTIYVKTKSRVYMRIKN